jgi:Kef-type K+ transport system membrane component KefB
MNLALLLAGIFLFTFLFGILLEKIRVPWIFAALILGLGMAFYDPFQALISSEPFKFLAQLGMYFLLFLVGFELDLEKIKNLESLL